VTTSNRAAPIPSRLLPDTAKIGADGHLSIGGCDVVDLAAEFGTQLFIYDEAHLRNRCREALAAFGDGVAYAGKAFLSVAMARLVHEEGLHLDVASSGELHTGIVAGVPGERIVLHGNNKSLEELQHARSENVGRVVVDSFDELDRLESLHAADGKVATVLIRVTPGVSAHTHEFISTGEDDSKFGFTISSGAATTAAQRAMASPAVDLVGIHCHIGSQVFRVESFAEALEVVAEFSEPFGLPELSLGGGLGVAYVEDDSAATITSWGSMLRQGCDRLGVKANVLAEPGRAIAAQAAITVYTVGTIKKLPGIRTYVAVDGGFGDNPRPVLYGSDYTAFLPARAGEARPDTVRVVGKHCESGDIIVREAPVPAGLQVGDLLATPVTGAYGHGMGSNYNRLARPAVVFAHEGDARLVVRRESLDDLVGLDVM
jgi:diaminopimelate decarboxylase